MWKTLIAKELRAHLLSFRFLAGFVTLFVLVVVTAFVLTGDYVRRLDECSARRTELDRYLRTYAHFNRIGNVLRPAQPPVPFQALVRGLTADVNMEAFDNDPLPVMFPLIDLTFIVTILVSLIALILTYDAVSGEKEEGTLKLMLANGLPRSKIVLAKAAGAGLMLLGPLVVSLAAGLLVIVLDPRVDWTGADWAALGLILVAAAAYATVFALIGILVSSVHRSSASSIMTSLFVWTLLVLVVPNLSPYAASFLSPAPSRIKVARETARLTDVDRDDLGRKLAAQYRAEVLREHPVLGERLTEAEVKRRVAEDPQYRAAYEAGRAAVQRAWDEANRVQNAKADELRRDLRKKEEAQTGLARAISMISPLADFSYLATDLSSTGTRNQAHFARLAGLWGQAFYRDYQPRKIEAFRAKDPTGDPWNTAIDMSDAPRFHYVEEGLGGRVRAALPPFGALLGFCVVLFAAAYVAFIRYDVR
ncbi:MAG TPA: ABC transporter permease subunit [Candidatus Aminicenantes bacterium]|nr:ABC transporter permease subunit [Candidatus Aminicenantes bacterium]